jgi:hypothetical protein
MSKDQAAPPPQQRDRRRSIRVSIDSFLEQNNLFSSVSSNARAKSSFRCTREFTSRVCEATRAFFVSLVTISILVIPGEGIFSTPWLGSVISISVLKSTLGDTMLAVKAVFVPLLPIAAIGYGISLMLNWLDTMVYSIVLPFVVMGGTLVVMLCPWPLLTSKNLMLVIFYLMVASPLSLRNERDPLAQEELDEVPTWFLLSFIGTASIGLFVAFSVHFILSFTPRSTASTRLSREMMKQLSYQTYSLLYSVSLWANNLGTDTQSIMRARGLIEYYITSRKNTLQLLSNSIDAIRVETNLPSCSSINSKYLGMVEEFIEFAQKQQQYTDMIQFIIGRGINFDQRNNKRNEDHDVASLRKCR